jgi:hypothetical protein
MRKELRDGKGQVAQLTLAAGMLLLLAGWLSGLSACRVAVREPVPEVERSVPNSEEVYRDEAPPPARSEVMIGTAPRPDYVWVGRYCDRYRKRGHWVRGRWALRPHADAVWVDGRWNRGLRGVFQKSGHWR